MVTIPLKVSDELAGRLLPLQDRLPEIIELGLRQIKAQIDADAEANLSASKARVLAALASTGTQACRAPASSQPPHANPGRRSTSQRNHH